ncbi:MAG TPA: hypothetical protein VN845_05300 [Solirubrobacteraceae bacterium]|nr:hypothetical protein [Solirubrobacteraceae bacterium]
MKSLIALLAVALLSGCIAACGSSGKGSAANASATASSTETGTVSTVPTDITPAPVETKVDADKDNDLGAAEGDDHNNNSTLDYGHEANVSDTRTITALVKRYYKAAYTENGAKACSMLYSTLEEAVPEDYGQAPPGPPYMSGTTCPAVLTLLFKHFHPQLAIEYPKLVVARVRMVEHHAIVILHFGALPERQIGVTREGHTWKMSQLLDAEVS